MAILLGTIVGGVASKGGGDPASFSALIIVFALLCWGASLLIPHTGEAAPALHIDRNIIRSTGRLLKASLERCPPAVGRRCPELVLARRRGGAVAPSAAW